jgi:hypothetical protein
MAPLAHKVQVLLTADQHRTLVRIAKAERKPLSVLLREGVVEHLVGKARRAARQKACDEIAAMDLPVEDWAKVEAQIERAHTKGEKRR